MMNHLKIIIIINILYKYTSLTVIKKNINLSNNINPKYNIHLNIMDNIKIIIKMMVITLNQWKEIRKKQKDTIELNYNKYLKYISFLS